MIVFSFNTVTIKFKKGLDRYLDSKINLCYFQGVVCVSPQSHLSIQI